MSLYKQLSSTAFFKYGFSLLILFFFAILSSIGYFHLDTLNKLREANLAILTSEARYQQQFYLMNGALDRQSEPAIKLIELSHLIDPQTLSTRQLNEEVLANTPASVNEGEYTFTELYYPPNQRAFLILIKPIATESLSEGLYKLTFLLTFIGFLLLVGFSYFIRHYFLRRLTFISDAANEILLGDLSKRIPIAETQKNNPDEISEVSITLNLMLDKIETLMTEVKQISNNIAHDLKSPINRIRNRMEVGLLQSRSDEDYQEILSQSIDDLDELLKTFNALLLMANIDGKKRNYALEAFDLSVLLDDMVELYQSSAEDNAKKYSLVLNNQSDSFIRGNKNLMAQVLSNLIENAVKYSQKDDTLIHVSLLLDNEFVRVLVEDNGMGIDSTFYDKVFQPFVRVDSSRTLPGTGLGLSLVKSIIQLHNGW